MVILIELFLTVYMLGRCGGLERTDFLKVSTLGGSGSPERTNF